MKKWALLLFFSISCILPALVIRTFTGSEDNNWHNPNNWDPPGIPAAGDDVNIPSGKLCTVSDDRTCGSLTVAGSLKVEQNSEVQVYGNVENSGTIDINGGDGATATSNTGINATGDIVNNGRINIQSIDNENTGLKSHNDITNNGYMHCNGAVIQANTFTNNGTTFTEAGGTTGRFTILADNFTNNGVMFEINDIGFWVNNFDVLHNRPNGNFLFIDGTAENPDGSSANFATTELTNEGTIKAGDAYLDGLAGNVRILTDMLNNSGEIRAGSGQDSGGNVYIYASEMDASHSIHHGGHSHSADGVGGDVNFYIEHTLQFIDAMAFPGSNGIKDGGRGNLYFYGDSIFFQPCDTAYISANVIYIQARAVVFDSITQTCQINADQRIIIKTTADGFVDFSGVHTENAICSFAADSQYIIYSNNVIEPSEGLDYIFNGAPPDIYPADTTILKAEIINSPFIEDTISSSGTFYSKIQNLSTTTKNFHLSLSSHRGWITISSGDISSVSPFHRDSTAISYSIPSFASAGEVDTIIIILSSGTATLDTEYAYIKATNPLLGIKTEKSSPSTRLRLIVFPNPFSSVVRFSCIHQEIKIYDISGKLVKIVRDGIWRGDDVYGKKVDMGIYYARTPDGGTVKLLKIK